MSSAFACTTANWESVENGGGSVTGAPTAGDPGDGVARYSGECGLAGAGGAANFVTNNAPDGESVYRARFYVHTGTTGTTTVFQATDADDNGGAVVLGVDYDAAAGEFVFEQNGAAAGEVAGIVANKWYSIELAYEAGTSFSAEVAGNQTFTGSIPAGAAGAGTIESHSLGVIAGGAGTVRVDAFESTRSADTPIGRLCRGDVNGTEPINVFDRTAVTNEIVNGTLAAGQPDCTEDGAINVFDRTCVTNLILDGGACP
ncbi:hypothetical protein [Chiayiivirga flava]|uniref:LamG domain-containing protein n=1 Tax=Chiayiivirga flava TaxID=659595 RepID=A0A7W8D3L6_9GAMM|nr:hypothetical protein [Chiayiivirga flava]MBB5207325.1 hypothetical protein [Chiayiivirga flava]